MSQYVMEDIMKNKRWSAAICAAAGLVLTIAVAGKLMGVPWEGRDSLSDTGRKDKSGRKDKIKKEYYSPPRRLNNVNSENVLQRPC